MPHSVFERGIDPEGVIKALNRAAQLIAELSGGNIYKNYIDEYPRKVPSAKNIPLRLNRINETVGATIKGKDIIRILKSIGMNVVAAGTDKYRVSPPTYRVDIAREIDLIEEVARLYGYDRIPAKLPNISVTEMVEIPRLKLEERNSIAVSRKWIFRSCQLQLYRTVISRPSLSGRK